MLQVTQHTTLIEYFPIKAPLNWANPDYEPNVINGKDKLTRLRVVSLARQEIQGAFQMFRAIRRNNVRDLDTVCSGILLPIKPEDMGCEYCETKHRNGDCKIPDLGELEDDCVAGGVGI